MFIHDQINEPGSMYFAAALWDARYAARIDYLGFKFLGEGRDFSLMWCAA